MKMHIAAISLALTFGAAAAASAQVANPTGILYFSPDHSAIIPAGQANAGQPVVADYRVLVFNQASDVSTAAPLIAGTFVAKANVVGIGPDLRITFAQSGITLPTCTATPCPQYTSLIDARGPNGISVRAVADESAPFTAALPAPPPVPRAPTNLRPN